MARRRTRSTLKFGLSISVYVLVAILKKRLSLEQSLYTILQVLSVTLLERIPILQALQNADYNNEEGGHWQTAVIIQLTTDSSDIESCLKINSLHPEHACRDEEFVTAIGLIGDGLIGMEPKDQVAGGDDVMGHCLQ